MKGKTGRSIEAVGDKLDAIKGEITRRIDDLIELFNARFPPLPYGTKSPIGLTDFGKEISGDVGASAIVDKLFDAMIDLTKAQTPYQIQETCFEFVKKKLLEEKPELKEVIESCSFNRGLEVHKVLRVIGIVLRDRILKHRNLSPPD